MKILVTGASGFVGRALVPKLKAAGHEIVAPPHGGGSAAADLADPATYLAFLRGVDAVVHLAAFNPPRWRLAGRDVARMRRLNAEAAAALGRLALAAGVRSFVFLSSARVYGLGGDRPFSEFDEPQPDDPYGASKLEAEVLLSDIFASAPECLAVFRAPVIYGRGRGGALGLVARFARAGIPFPAPYGAAPKSVLHIRNLVSALRLVLEAPEPVYGTFNLTDGPPVTLAQVGAVVARSCDRRFRTFPVPSPAMRLMARLPGLGAAFAHLAAPCVLDDSRFRQVTGWTPPNTGFAAIEASFAAGH